MDFCSAAVLPGATKHLGIDNREFLTVEATSAEALTASEIEEGILERASVQSPIRRPLGPATGAFGPPSKALPKSW